MKLKIKLNRSELIVFRDMVAHLIKTYDIPKCKENPCLYCSMAVVTPLYQRIWAKNDTFKHTDQKEVNLSLSLAESMAMADFILAGVFDPFIATKRPEDLSTNSYESNFIQQLYTRIHKYYQLNVQ